MTLPTMQDAAAEGRGWRPIETAPKDGTDVLLINVDRKMKVTPYIGWYHQTGKDWVNTYSGDGQKRPTHWMPLPEPPEANP